LSRREAVLGGGNTKFKNNKTRKRET